MLQVTPPTAPESLLRFAEQVYELPAADAQ
jgi:hypothetical protein